MERTCACVHSILEQEKTEDNQSFSIIAQFKAAQQNCVLPRQLGVTILPTRLEHGSEMKREGSGLECGRL